MSPNTLFLRLEGPMQAWGDQQSKFVIRRTGEAPTKSGVEGILCAGLGVGRADAAKGWLSTLNGLKMGVRIDRPGIRWWDYHTVGAHLRMRIAQGEGKTKEGALLSRREYLCDASFLVVLQGDPELVTQLEAALCKPTWTPYLGRKCCPPSRPLLESAPATFSDLMSALRSIPWQPRFKGESKPERMECLLDWSPTPEQPKAPDEAHIWYDVPLSFAPPAHRPRFVVRESLRVDDDGHVKTAEKPAQKQTPPPPRPRANYRNTEYRRIREERLKRDNDLCVFCKSWSTTVQHVTYRHAGGQERLEELRSLCRLCHDAVTMLEYGMGMGLDRINPEDPQWRDRIAQKRNEIIQFRSLETRRRKLAAEEVE